MFAAFVSLIVAGAIASKHRDQTSRNAWTCLALAGVAQTFSFLAYPDFRNKGFEGYRLISTIIVASPAVSA
jgi:predicted permease